MKPNIAGALAMAFFNDLGAHVKQRERRSTPPSKLNRSDDDIQSRLDKQAAKLARRAKRAGFEQK